MHLRFFLSSPGDVADERTFAQQVIEQELPKAPLLRGQITCEVMRWDDPNGPVAMPATQTAQEAVHEVSARWHDDGKASHRWLRQIQESNSRKL